jgi:hypothetical protein
MKHRGLLRKQITKAWNAAISQDYQRQRINSERSLQASLWSQLNSILPPKSRRMFIEPTLKIEREGTREFRIPDFVICNTKEVIGIIEIKYIPRAKPNWKKDVDTFDWICKNRNKLVVQNKRHRGVESDGRIYPISKDLLIVWAGVHRDSDLLIKDHFKPKVSDSFLELY